jgi:single-strand DNA-binding protein
LNTWNGSGFLTKDPDVKEIQTKSGENMKMARFTIACQRKGKNAGADFIGCVAYGKTAEVIEKYFKKGKGIEVRGHIQTGSYEKNGQKVYTTDISVEEIEFPKVTRAEQEQAAQTNEEPSTQEQPQSAPEGFMEISSGGDEFSDLPFK